MNKKLNALIDKVGHAILDHDPTDVLLVLATVAAAVVKKYNANAAAFIEAFNAACDANGRAEERHPRLVG